MYAIGSFTYVLITLKSGLYELQEIANHNHGQQNSGALLAYL